MSHYKPTLNVLPPLKVAPFATIVRRVAESQGSLEKAAALLGVSCTVLSRVLSEAYLTDKQARLILAGSKRLKDTGVLQ